MPSICIIDTPIGEAPEEIRRAWVGLVLPLVDGPQGQRGTYLGTGVLTGPKTFLSSLKSWIFKRYQKYDGYPVDAPKAIAILAAKDSHAADWWKQNAPHLNTAGHRLLFPAEVCLEVGMDEGMKSPIAPPR